MLTWWQVTYWKFYTKSASYMAWNVVPLLGKVTASYPRMHM